MTAVEKRLLVLVCVGILDQNFEKFIWPAKLCRGRLAVVVDGAVVVDEELLGRTTVTTLGKGWQLREELNTFGVAQNTEKSPSSSAVFLFLFSASSFFLSSKTKEPGEQTTLGRAEATAAAAAHSSSGILSLLKLTSGSSCNGVTGRQINGDSN